MLREVGPLCAHDAGDGFNTNSRERDEGLQRRGSPAPHPSGPAQTRALVLSWPRSVRPPASRVPLRVAQPSSKLDRCERVEALVPTTSTACEMVK